jgi:alanine racemase
MDRRRFLKIGLGGLGSLYISSSLPVAAKDSAGPETILKNLLNIQQTESGIQPFAHDSRMIVDPEIFTRNISTLRKEMGPDVKVCLVMKSDAYGHGIENLTREAVLARPDYIGLVENREIRRIVKCMDGLGEKATILRIAPATFYEAAESAVKGWDVEEVVGSLPQAKMLSRIATWISKKHGIDFHFPIHININTGMARMGFMRMAEVKEAINLPGLKLRGAMTHFANAYDPEKGERLTKKQMDIFDAKLSGLNLPDDIIIHTANSGAALSFPWTRRNMVRVGGALYGDIPVEMNPENRYPRVARSFSSNVVWIMEDVPANTPVGYDSVYHTPKNRNSTLATVKIGYNNGVPSWAYAKNSEVLIRGQRFPMVGKTSMNMLVIDISGQNPDQRIQLGDEVVIFGKQGNEQITIEDLEKSTGIPGCEILLAIGKENPRIIASDK